MGEYETSIVVDDLTVCNVCGRPAEVHHIFYGTANRRLSTKYHLTIGLCPERHRDSLKGVHGLNKELDNELKAVAQKRCMEVYGLSTDEFIAVFDKNYI